MLYIRARRRIYCIVQVARLTLHDTGTSLCIFSLLFSVVNFCYDLDDDNCRRPLTTVVNLEAVLLHADDRPARERAVL